MQNVRDFGAKGNGIAKDTKAIQAAIDAGGIVHFPPGTYLSGSLYLRSNGGLELEPGAKLLASPDPEDYNAADFCPQNWASKNEVTSGGHFINAVNVENIVLRGGGIIDGNHRAFLNDTHANKVWYKLVWRPAQMIFLCESKDIWIQGLKLQNSPYWTCFLYGCEFATISDVHIHGDDKVPNQDGIDIDSCRFVAVNNCVINSADDCLTLRGDNRRLTTPKTCENVTFSNCVLRSGYANALRIGVGDGDIKNCTFNNIVITDTRTAVCIVSKYSPKGGRGVAIEDVAFSNIQCDVHRFLNLKTDNNDNFEKPGQREIKRISFSQIRGNVELTSYIGANTYEKISDITFSDIDLAYAGTGPRPNLTPEGHWGYHSGPAAFSIKNAKRITFDKTRVHWLNDEPGWTHEFEVENSDVDININCNIEKGILRK